MQARVIREQGYWDQHYQSADPEHPRYCWTKHIESVSYIAARFQHLLRGVRRKHILSLGGGVDRLGLSLARADNRVVTVDVSPVAAAANAALAQRAGLADRLIPRVAPAEEVDFARESFDVVICKRALHHMDLTRVIPRARDLLRRGGMFLAEEPVCLLPLLRWFHQHCPFHPEAAPRTADERELTDDDLTFIRDVFGKVELSYFDLLARESVAYFLVKGRAARLLNPLGKLDYVLINCCPALLRYLSTYVILRAIK